MNKTVTFWSGIIGTLLFIVSSILGGALIPGYNHIQQFISESYAIDTTYGIYIRLFGYIPTGIFITAFAFSALKFLPKSSLTKIGLILFGVFYGAGTIIVAIFPCDAGCNRALINPSISQLIHNFSGGLTYLVVPICLILIGISAKKWGNGKRIAMLSIICGIVAIVFTQLLVINSESNYIGFYQRLVESCILFWLINFALYIKTKTNT
ncbi:DUF998 domain-containing protein [Lacinutrix jangbogonensis]|uniref:DUF998 domain-containing protein n=1 Tax=Lacinutrix jangbogonensis TaxID=1469557 RepID=UPI00053DD192|nr:DUF998 domain-containing protein [Lacinutrix jangbogonensis]